MYGGIVGGYIAEYLVEHGYMTHVVSDNALSIIVGAIVGASISVYTDIDYYVSLLGYMPIEHVTTTNPQIVEFKSCINDISETLMDPNDLKTEVSKCLIDSSL